MVNRGPSAGCQACRERRVGCDKARPPPPPPALLPPLRSHARDVATAFFFRRCVLPTRQQWPLGNEYFEHILPLYNSARPSSALPAALSVMALSVATAHRSQALVQPLLAETELAAIKAVNVALSDPRQCLKDDTLLAIFCLNFAQQFRGQLAALRPDRPHLHGALALIRHRGPVAFNSRISQSLHTATRNHLLLNALWSEDGSAEQDLLIKLPEVAPPHADAACTIQHILQQVLCLESQILTAREPGTLVRCSSSTFM